MKKVKIVMSMMLSVLFVALVSCSAGDRLQSEVDAFNKQCPQDMGNGMEMTSVSIESNELIYLFTVDAGKLGVPFSMLKSTQSTMKDGVKGTIAGDASIKKLAELLIEANYPMVFRYKDKAGGDSFDVKITPEELKEALGKK